METDLNVSFFRLWQQNINIKERLINPHRIFTLRSSSHDTLFRDPILPTRDRPEPIY